MPPNSIRIAFSALKVRPRITPQPPFFKWKKEGVRHRDYRRSRSASDNAPFKVFRKTRTPCRQIFRSRECSLLNRPILTKSRRETILFINSSAPETSAMEHRFIHNRPRSPSTAPAKTEAFKEFDATELYCPQCKRAAPVRKRLLLVLPEGEKYEYFCAICSTSVGTKLVRGPEDRLHVII